MKLSKYKELLNSVFKSKLSIFAFGVFSTFVLIAIVATGYQIYCSHNATTPIYDIADFANRYQPPSWSHLFGTDYLGRDVFIRALFGSATAIKIGFIASIISGSIGVVLGMIAGYYKGIADSIIVWIYSTFASIPSLLFILAFAILITKGYLYAPLLDVLKAISAVSGTELGMMAVYLGIGFTGWVTICRIVRAEVLKVKEMQFIQASKVLGFSNIRILLKHILPNIFHLVIIYSTMRFAYAIMTEVIVSFLGVGVQLSPSWGIMIADGQQRLWRGVWWEVAGATLFMFLLVLSLHLLGDILRDILDPRLKETE
jgi:peptide/nickel transport system permease protein